jgi:molybdopterin-containing oxidoreductase family membrane subunit
VYGLEDFITRLHLQNSAKLLLATGLMVTYGYMIEAFMAWYSNNTFEQFTQINRMFGPYAGVYWSLIACNCVIPQVLWLRQARSSTLALFLVSCVILIGMWLERFMIVITSLHRDYLPSSWGMYAPTLWDWATFVGSIGLFCTLLFVFIRFLPMISISEMRTLLPQAATVREETSP